MNYHHQNKNRNAEKASYMHGQRDSVRTVTRSAPPRRRPTPGFHNKADVNKDKLNLCPGEGLSWCGSLLTALGLGVGFPAWIADLRSSSSLLLLGQHHYNIFDTKPEDRIQEESGTCFKGHGRILKLDADELARHLLRDLPPCRALCSPWVVSFHAGGLFLRGWHFLVPLSARFNYICQITTLSFLEDIMITFLKGLVWGLTAIFLTASHLSHYALLNHFIL